MNDQALQPNKLFVGNVAYQVTEDMLRQTFSQFGNITDLKLIIDRMTGRSKGFAFIEYETEEEAQAAIEAMHGQELEGRALAVNVARPMAPRAPRQFDGGGDRRGGFGGGGRRPFNNRRDD